LHLTLAEVVDRVRGARSVCRTPGVTSIDIPVAPLDRRVCSHARRTTAYTSVFVCMSACRKDDDGWIHHRRGAHQPRPCYR
jgi:hypothetical protein